MSRRLALVLVVTVILAGACSAPVDSGPKTIRSASIPVGLRLESSTTTTTVPAGASEEVTVYFIGRQDERLQPVKRRVSTPVTPEKVLEALFAGPTDAEAINVRTAISGDTTILRADIEEGGLVTVDTSKNFAFGLPTDQIAAYAQVVFTALDVPGVTGVQFAQNGRRISVQAGDGSSNTTPLGRASYSQLTPR